MTKQQALDLIEKSDATHFRYGDLSYATPKDEAVEDIQNIDVWNDGEILEDTDGKD